MRFMILFGLLCVYLKFPITKCFSKSFVGKDNDNIWEIIQVSAKENDIAEAEKFSLTDNVLFTLVN